MNNALPPGFTLRPPTMDDALSVHALLTACQVAEYGTSTQTLDDLHTRWQVPNFHLATDAWVVTTPQGHIVGYADVQRWVQTHIYAFARVHPRYCGHSLGSHLVRLSEARARQYIPAVPPDTRITLYNWINSVNKAAAQLLECEGYTLTRSSWRMEIDMEKAPLRPAFPPGITVHPFVQGRDERLVFETDDEAFHDHWGYMPTSFELWEHWMINRPTFDPDLWFLAFDGDQIAGICLSRYEQETGWVETLAVRRPWRRHGLGIALVLHAFNAFYQRGIRKAALSVDAQNLTGATRLYERAGMHVARQSDAYTKELRPGKELSTQAIAE